MEAAILEINPEVLKFLLQIPSDTKIIGVEMDADRLCVVRIKIIGAGWPVEEGGLIVSTTGRITDPFKATIDWGFPK